MAAGVATAGAEEEPDSVSANMEADRGSWLHDQHGVSNLSWVRTVVIAAGVCVT